MESERLELHKSLVDDIIKGMEQVKQLQVSSAKSDQERMLASYEEALLILTGRAPQGQCHSGISSSSDPPPNPPSRTSLKRKSREDGPVKIITSESDDGYSWKKYGHKEILGGSKFPRSYYRCVQWSQGCSATKQMQRSDIDPTKFEVTYNGKHTCQLGASAKPKTGIVIPFMQASHSATSDK